PSFPTRRSSDLVDDDVAEIMFFEIVHNDLVVARNDHQNSVDVAVVEQRKIVVGALRMIDSALCIKHQAIVQAFGCAGHTTQNFTHVGGGDVWNEQCHQS